VIGADFAFEGFDRPGLGAERFVIPALDHGKPEDHPVAGNRVTPLFGRQFLELPLELAARGRRGQKICRLICQMVLAPAFSDSVL